MDFLVLCFQKLEIFFDNPEHLRLFTQNRYMMILLVIILLRLKYATYSNIYLSALVNIPGTILHETAHFIIGLFLNAMPTSYSLIPVKRGDGYVMGSVGFKNVRFYNAIPASLAPLLLLIVGYYFNRWYFMNIKPSYINYIGYIFLQTVIIENAVPSSTDFKVAFSYPLGILLYGALAAFAVIYFI